jgi:hypothetical protein
MRRCSTAHPGVRIRHAGHCLMAWLLGLLVLVSGCERAPVETPPCAGYWVLETAGLIEPSDHATGLRACVTTSGRHCSIASLASTRSDGGFAPIPANDAHVIRDLIVQVMERDNVLRRAHLTRLAFPRLAHTPFCHRVEIHYEHATGALYGVFIR